MEDSLSSSKRHTKTARKEGGCYHCGSSSHRAKSCPNATCRLCGNSGHDAGGCPYKPLSPVDLGQFKAQTQTQGAGFSYIELFCGMGGFRVALDKLGGQCVFASEIDRFCVQNYQDNFGDRPAGDICRIQTHEIPNHDLLVGGFPCQPFSTSGARLGIQDPNGKGVLFLEIVRILKGKKPRAFLLENVRGLYLHDDGKTLKRVVKELEECGYIVKYELVDAVKLLPQERCRLFLVGVRRDLHLRNNQAQPTEFKFPNLPQLGRGIRDILHHVGDGHLTLSKMKKLTLNPNQLNKVKSQKYTQEHPEARFLSDPTVASKTIQSSYTKYMVGSQFIPVQFGKHVNDNNDEWRRFSSREVARLQGFPESFRLCTERAYHMIGNAVAPPVIVMIAAPMLQFCDLGGGNDNHDETTRDWGWTVAQSLLLEASPDDSRRKELESTLRLVRSEDMSGK
jgi:DNA (cytosine-5)-methyltransferase 1